MSRTNDSTDLHEDLTRTAKKGHAEEADRKYWAEQKR